MLPENILSASLTALVVVGGIGYALSVYAKKEQERQAEEAVPQEGGRSRRRRIRKNKSRRHK